MNPSFIGFFAVLLWGISLPLVRVFEDRIGIPVTVGVLFGGAGILSLTRLFVLREPFPSREVWSNPYLYGRWLFFVLHESLCTGSVGIVQKIHLPFVILINYLWPTAIILCSVLLAGVKITRWPAFISGCVIVVASLSIEIMGHEGFSLALFSDAKDCLAYAMCFAGAVSWGLYCALSRRAGNVTGGGSVIPFFQLTLGLILLFSFVPGFSTWGNLTGWWPVLLFGFCVLQFVAYLCWDFGMRLGNVVVLSLCADFIPWLSLLGAYLLVGSDIEGKTILSAVCLVLGAMVTRYGTLQKITKDEIPEI